MAVNLKEPENLIPVAGIKLGTTNSGIRYQGRDDLLVMELAEGTRSATVFTRNAFCAAPVTVARRHLEQAIPRYLVINAGNANAGTGELGMQAALASCEGLAQLTGSEANQVLPFSTGVIGEVLPADKLVAALPQAVESLSEDNWLAAAHAIKTTDTVAKAASQQIEIDGKTITVTGISKGSGMIHPNMATMLSYVATDADVEQEMLQTLLREVANESYNCITVDGDTSTNDAVVLMATGQSGVVITEATRAAFKQAVLAVCLEIAQAVIRDGEGATKFITIDVQQANSIEEAHAVGNSVALSPLVKTAMFASDPNWGRILAAVGYSPVEALDVSKITIYLGDTLLIEDGEPAASYTEEQGQAEMNKEEINVRILLARGEVSAQTWTCDFSYDYVKINAEYRS